MRLDTLRKAIGVLVLGFASPAYPIATYTPSSTSISYSIGIPSGSTLSTTTAGALYIQLSCPTTHTWCALGLGSQMASSTILVMYTNGAGNVTVSARPGGGGHVQPLQSPSLQAGITLLAGSGVVGGNMVANVKCTTCLLDGSSPQGKSNWIAAWYEGSALDSASTSATIRQHDSGNHRQFTFDLSAAAVSADANPFLAAASPSASGTGSATASSASATGTGSGDSKGQGSGSGSNGSGSEENRSSPTIKQLHDYDIAHGVIMGVAVVLLFPLGAIWMRLGGNMIVHALVQLVGLACLLAGLGLGVKLGQWRGYLFKSTGTAHTIFGVTIIALFLIQPFLGAIHHMHYVRTSSRTPVSHVHIWYGRVLMLLAIVNGGLGLKLANNSQNGKIVYGVVAGVVGAAYIVLVVLKRKGGGGGLGMRRKAEREGSSAGSREEGAPGGETGVYK